MLTRIKEEAQGFRAALEAAPVAPVERDLWGARLLSRKLVWLLLREHTEPRRLALAVFVGVMIGASPFYLLHTALVVVLALALRLNKLAVWIASNVSLPFIAPALIFASMQLGHRVLEATWLPMNLAGVRAMLTERGAMALGLDLWLYWLIGSVPVGLVLGGLLAGVTWLVATRRAARRAATRDE